MAEKQPRKKPKAGAKDEAGVLASLPATRPGRISGHARSTSASGAAPRAKAKPVEAAAKPKPRQRAETAPKPVPASVPTAAPARPRPVRSASRNLAAPARKAADQRPPKDPPQDRSPSATDLVTTVVQAAGELAQVGLTVGGQILKRAVEKLPKP